MRKQMIYVAEDGKTFHDRDDCVQHEVTVYLNLQMAALELTPPERWRAAKAISQHLNAFEKMVEGAKKIMQNDVEEV